MKIGITILTIAATLLVFGQNGKGHGNQGGNKGKSQGSVQQGNQGNGPASKTKGNQGDQIKFSSGKNKIAVKSKGNSSKVKADFKPGGQAGIHDNGHGKGNKMKGHPSKVYKASNKYHYKKSHVNFVYMYNYNPFVYPTKNYGQWRSQQARNKHKMYHPVLVVDMRNAIVMIRDRNAMLLVGIDAKLDRLRTLLYAKHEAGKISDMQLSIQLVAVERLNRKRGHYHYD